MGTEGPVDQEYVDKMEAISAVIDEVFNGDKKGLDRDVGFALLVFPIGEGSDQGRMNYMSNSHRKDMLCALKELVARFEGRHAEESECINTKEIQ